MSSLLIFVSLFRLLFWARPFLPLWMKVLYKVYLVFWIGKCGEIIQSRWMKKKNPGKIDTKHIDERELNNKEKCAVRTTPVNWIKGCSTFWYGYRGRYLKTNWTAGRLCVTTNKMSVYEYEWCRVMKNKQKL